MRAAEMTIRPETPADENEIAAVNRAAFGGEAEVALIARLRAEGVVMIALVAVSGPEIVGHIVFSRMTAEIGGRTLHALALAPVAVAPAVQSRAIGSQLIEAGLTIAKESGQDAVFVLGHPRYYPRFGFDPALAARFKAPFHGPAFMALALKPGALDGVAGSVTYPAAFGL